MRQPNAREKYLSETFSIEDESLKTIRAALKQDQKDGIQISASDARILQFLLRLKKIRTVVEIGTLYGYSTLCLARALPEEGILYSLDVSELHHAKAREFLKATPEWSKIQLITGEARDNLRELATRAPFDAVFIDANKSAYIDYLDWAEAHVRKGGLIIGDNTFLFDAVFGEGRNLNTKEKQIQIMHEFNSRLSDSERYNSCLIPTTEGLTVAEKLR